MPKGIRVTYTLLDSDKIIADIKSGSFDEAVLNIKNMLSERNKPEAVETIYLSNRHARIIPVEHILDVEVQDITKEIVENHRQKRNP